MIELLDRQHAARVLGIHPRTLERMVQDGRGPKAVRLRGRVMYRPETLAKWVEGLEQ